MKGNAVAITLKGKVCKVRVIPDGAPWYETVFLAKGSDHVDAIWTRQADEAEILEWSEAEKLATKLKGHAVVVAGTMPVEAVAPVPPKPPTAKKASLYRPRRAHQQGRSIRPPAGQSVTRYQQELTRQHLF